MNILIVKTSKNPNNNVEANHEDQIRKIEPKAQINQTTADDPGFPKLLENVDIVMTQNLAIVEVSKAPNLKWIHLTSAGVNNLTDELRKSDVIITNSSGVHPVPISEHVLGFMLMLVRNMHMSYRNQLNRKWVRGEGMLPINELAGKSACIVGLGAIGERVAMLCKAFEMQTSGVVRNPEKDRKFVDKLIGPGDLKEAVSRADFVINCLPGTAETKHFFDAQVFEGFKKGSFFINIGRGTTVDEEALLKALTDGTLLGAGLDVFETEPLPENSPLWDLDNIIITPHYSGWSPRYADRMIDIFCENLNGYLNKKTMPNLVDKQLGY